MKMMSMHDLFVHNIKDLYSAEKQITKALPKMIKKTQTPELKQAFETHLEQTEQQIKRLEQIAEMIGSSPSGMKCKGMEGLIEEGRELLEEDIDPTVLDAAMIGAAQKIEHYEISGYGTACAHAELLGHDQALTLLRETLGEEEETDHLLSQIAETKVNMKAAQ